MKKQIYHFALFKKTIAVFLTTFFLLSPYLTYADETKTYDLGKFQYILSSSFSAYTEDNSRRQYYE